MKDIARRNTAGYAFILPWLIGLTVFIAYPFFASLYFSFCEFPPLKNPMLVGLANYGELAADPAFHRSMGTTLIYASVAIPLGVILALSLAMFLNTRIRGLSVYRVVFYLPQLVPTVAVAILWLWIFNPATGLLNMVLHIALGAVDWCTGLFFDLSGAYSGEAFLRPVAAVLLLFPALAVVTFSRWTPPAVRDRPRLRMFLAGVAIAGLLLGALAFLNTLLCRLLPLDMTKLRSPGWLSDAEPFPSAVPFAPSWALWALIVMSMWGVGQMAVIYLAKLQDVPADLYEAAEIDGANWWHKTWHITIPMISPVILFNVVMGIIGTFQVFTAPYIMTGGGPEDKTRFVAMFVYDQVFRYQRVGYASAVAWILFILILVLTLLAFRISKKHVYYEAR